MEYIKYKDIESKIFGMRIGQLIVNGPEDIPLAINEDSLGYDLIDIRVPYNLMRYVKDVQLLNRIRYVGSIVTFELDTKNNLYTTKNCRWGKDKDLEECIRIGKESFVSLEDGINRFNLDLLFKNEDIEKYYIEWVKNCFNKTSADEVVIYDDGNDDRNDDECRIKGFIGIKKIEDDIYNIPLVAVKRSERGKGIYKDMVCSVFDRLNNNVRVNTRTYLGNIATQKVWLGLGAEIKNIDMVFHYHGIGNK